MCGRSDDTHTLALKKGHLAQIFPHSIVLYDLKYQKKVLDFEGKERQLHNDFRYAINKEETLVAVVCSVLNEQTQILKVFLKDKGLEHGSGTF